MFGPAGIVTTAKYREHMLAIRLPTHMTLFGFCLMCPLAIRITCNIGSSAQLPQKWSRRCYAPHYSKLFKTTR
eukprot:4687860-Pyramimonas_sp.AAC.1